MRMEEVGGDDVILTVLAIDSNGRVAVSTSAIELPTLPPPSASPGSNMAVLLKMHFDGRNGYHLEQFDVSAVVMMKT